MLELHHVKIDGLLADCSLTVGDGEMVGIYGEAGTGKTTLLRAVLGMVSIDGGHISIDGELLTPLSAPFFRRATAYVPQQLSLVEGYDTIAQCDATVNSLKINSRETTVQESSQGEEDGRTWSSSFCRLCIVPLACERRSSLWMNLRHKYQKQHDRQQTKCFWKQLATEHRYWLLTP